MSTRFLLPSILNSLSLLLAMSFASPGIAQEPPNIILIMTDDQGIGDLGVMGNPVIETPNIDQLANESGWLTNFYVHPVCAPTRACLMTGRYNYRTRAIDTYIGRAMMEPEEVTIAEVLKDAGYATGIFGKWHLGDCYPMRAMDQGFETAIVHRGGGIGQPSDPVEAPRQYTDPFLFRNGRGEQFNGYCTDVYYDEAMKFIDESQQSKKPFFVYLPDNTPHGPFHDVPQDLYQRYLDKKITREMFDNAPGHPIGEPDADFLARVYAMIGNVDRNIGRLMNHLDDLNLHENTIVIFMCDNGPNSRRYVTGLKGNKSSVYEGGIRSPFFIRWPGKIRSDYKLGTVSAHIDIMPTLLGLARVPVPGDLALDGFDLSPQLREEAAEVPERNIFIQSHRGNAPVQYHHFAVRNQKWKLLHHSGFGKENFEGEPRFELYDMQGDPFEEENVAARNPDIVKEMRSAYEEWFADVGQTRPNNYAAPRIVINSTHENPVVLTRQDWRKTDGDGWGSGGHWLIRVDQQSTLTLQCRLLKNKPADKIRLIISGRTDVTVATDTTNDDQFTGTFRDVVLEPGEYQLGAVVEYEQGTEGVYQIQINSITKQ